MASPLLPPSSWFQGGSGQSKPGGRSSLLGQVAGPRLPGEPCPLTHARSGWGQGFCRGLSRAPEVPMSPPGTSSSLCSHSGDSSPRTSLQSGKWKLLFSMPYARRGHGTGRGTVVQDSTGGQCPRARAHTGPCLAPHLCKCR